MSKKVLITGGSRGIGAATVRKYIEEGYITAFFYKNNDKAAHEIEAQTGAVAIKCDISHKDELLRGINSAKTLMGTQFFDVIVCNAGISHIGLFDMMSDTEWNEIVNCNLNGNVNLVKELLPEMISRKAGSIVMISSMWGQVGASCEVAYSTTKAAIIGFVKSLAKEVGPSGIRINCIAPGVIDTDMNGQLTADTLRELEDEIPLGRMGSCKEVAEIIYFLGSEYASYITGQVIGVNGGMVC